MATKATEDTTSTHLPPSNDASRGTTNEGRTPGRIAPAGSPPSTEALDAAVPDPYDNIACTD